MLMIVDNMCLGSREVVLQEESEEVIDNDRAGCWSLAIDAEIVSLCRASPRRLFAEPWRGQHLRRLAKPLAFLTSYETFGTEGFIQVALACS